MFSATSARDSGGLRLQFRRQIGFDAVDQQQRQLGENRPDPLGRLLEQHLRRVHRHARADRSNQACNLILLAHRLLPELYAAISIARMPDQFQLGRP